MKSLAALSLLKHAIANAHEHKGVGVLVANSKIMVDWIFEIIGEGAFNIGTAGDRRLNIVPITMRKFLSKIVLLIAPSCRNTAVTDAIAKNRVRYVGKLTMFGKFTKQVIILGWTGVRVKTSIKCCLTAINDR